MVKHPFFAHGGEEDVLIDKETINCQFNILLELDELLGNLDNTLRHVLAIPLTVFPFILRTDFDVIGGYIHPRETPLHLQLL